MDNLEGDDPNGAYGYFRDLASNNWPVFSQIPAAASQAPATMPAPELESPEHESRHGDIRPPSPKRCKIERDQVEERPVDFCSDSRVSWPVSEIPVEIFELITSYLARAEVKSLRLVCREFDSKVSAQYFKNVVVPFRSELYGTLPVDETGVRQHPSSALFSDGLRIFESFGPHILRFALSLEIDEDALAHPPIKPAQQAVPSFWGIYRWPHQSYNRYADLESIEQTADETEGMKEALQCLTKVTNLGLCCDAGLGFLVRPDLAARNASTQHPVFATQNWRRERPTVHAEENESFVTIADFNGLTGLRRKGSTDTLYFKRTVLDKMAADAGYFGKEAEEAIQLLLDTEQTDLNHIGLHDGSTNALSFLNDTPDRNQLLETHEFDELTRIMFSRRNASRMRNRFPDLRQYPLVPAELNHSQKELLLELEWAHRAMIQSYVIAMVDNARLGTLDRLTTLTIAKIPSSHVHIFYRDDFWSSFPSLANVSLGVIADWRRISKPAPSYVVDRPVSPLEAVSKVYKLLNDYIGKQPSIESLQFEWICGGEFAPSFFQRNMYILPAPLIDDHEIMASPDGAVANTDRLLSLPHVKHLRLKNCWVSPQVFLQTTRQMALSSLEKLELESVSLSGRPTTEHQFPLGQAQTQMQHQAAFNLALVQAQQVQGQPLSAQPQHWAVQHPLLPQPDQPYPVPIAFEALAQQVNGNESDDSPLSTPPPDNTRHPDWYSWAGFLEHFSPSRNVRNMLGDQDEHTDATLGSWETKITSAGAFIPEARRLVADERCYKLKCLMMKSCGYVSVDSSHLETRGLLPAGANSLGSPAITDAHASIYRLMQRTKDGLFGRIIPYIEPGELSHLTEVFGMNLGWSGIYPEKIINDAIADGTDLPGTGRFSGVLLSTDLGPWAGDSSVVSMPDVWDNTVESNPV